MPADSLRQYALDAMLLLEEAAENYRQGKRPYYRVAAVQLRILLCDTTRRHNQTAPISLLPQLLPQLSLPALSGAFLSGDVKQAPLFEPAAPPLPLEDWLSQQFNLVGHASLSIRELIRTVADQDGGAHVDRRAAYARLDPAGEYIERLIKLAQALAPILRQKFEK